MYVEQQLFAPLETEIRDVWLNFCYSRCKHDPLSFFCGKYLLHMKHKIWCEVFQIITTINNVINTLHIINPFVIWD